MDYDKKYLAAILILSLAASLIVISRPSTIWWDESVYISVGKYMYSDGQSGFPEPLRPVLLPSILGLIWRLGINPIIAGKIIAISSSLALIYMTYSIAKKTGDKNRAILSAALLSITGYYIFFSTKILTDIPSTLLVAIALNEAMKDKLTKKSIEIAGISSALAVMMRYTSLSLIAPVALAIILRSFSEKNTKDTMKKAAQSISLYCASFILVMTPYLLYMRNIYGDALYSMKAAIITINQSVAYYDTTTIYLIRSILENNPLLIFSIIGLITYASRKDLRKNIIIIETLIACASFLSIHINIIRYTLIALPYLCILAASGIAYTTEKITKKEFSLPHLKSSLELIILAFVAVGAWQFASGNIIVEKDSALWEDMYGTTIDTKETGPILVTDPGIGAYIDNRIIPFAWPDYAFLVYEQNISDSSLIFINTCDLLCIEGDTDCEARRTLFLAMVESENTLIREEKTEACRLILMKAKS